MIKTLRIQNFQSHADTKIELSPTVTIFTGESDQGKTAIVRAFRKIARNTPTGDFFIRYGQKDCTITMTVDGKDITRKVGKKNSVNLYDVAGTPYNNFGVGIPEEVKQELCIADVQVFEKEKIDLNIRTQHEGLFLAGGTGVETLRGRIFGKVTGSDVINRAVTNLNSTVRAQNKMREELVSKLSGLDSSLLSMTYVEELQPIISDIWQLSTEIESLEIFVQQALQLKNNMSSTLKDKANVQSSLAVLDSIDLEDITNKLNEFSLLDSLKQQITDVYAQLKTFAGLEKLTDDFSIIDLTNLVVNITSYKDLLSSIQALELELEGLEPVLSIQDDFDLTQGVTLAVGLDNLNNMRTQLRFALQQKQQVEAELEGISDSLVIADRELEECKQELGVCPTCDRPFAE